MPLPANFHSTVEEVLQAYPKPLVTVSCQKTSGKGVFYRCSRGAQELIAHEVQGSFWADTGQYTPLPLLTISSDAYAGVRNCTQCVSLSHMLVRHNCFAAMAC